MYFIYISFNLNHRLHNRYNDDDHHKNYELRTTNYELRTTNYLSQHKHYLNPLSIVVDEFYLYSILFILYLKVYVPYFLFRPICYFSILTFLTTFFLLLLSLLATPHLLTWYCFLLLWLSLCSHFYFYFYYIYMLLFLVSEYSSQHEMITFISFLWLIPLDFSSPSILAYIT